MSLFSAKSIPQCIILNPSKVTVKGNLVESFFFGTIEMEYINDSFPLDKYQILIGKNENSIICLHDFQIKIDQTPLSLEITETDEETRNVYKPVVSQKEKQIFDIGDDSYIHFDIPDILKGQKISISACFELSIKFILNNKICIFFPLTCPGFFNDEIIKCTDFKFSVRSSIFKFDEKSITSNPDGKIDLLTSTYLIDHLDPFISNISIIYDLNPPSFSELFIQEQISYNDTNGICECCGKYGLLTFVPLADEMSDQNDHSGEEFIFLIDCSSSMKDEINLVSESLVFYIKSLPTDCYFNIIPFGSCFDPFFENPVLLNDSNAERALNMAKTLKKNMDGTDLLSPLSYVFAAPLSKEDKLRRIFILTDGCIIEKSEVIDLVKKNTTSTMTNAIGIGYGVDKKLVEEIAIAGGGFFDFILSGDAMISKVINQLSKSLKNFKRFHISIENNEDVEIVPPMQNCQITPGIPITFYFKAQKDFDENLHIKIDVDEKSYAFEMKLLQSSYALFSLEHLFVSEKIKSLRKSEQSNEIISEIKHMSIDYGILTPYTQLIVSRKSISQDEIDQIELEKKKLQSQSFNIIIKCLTMDPFTLFVNPYDTVFDIKKQIEDIHGIPTWMISFIYESKELSPYFNLKHYLIKPETSLHMYLKLRGGGEPEIIYMREYPKRNFITSKIDDLISIISEQLVNGNWKKIPDFFNRFNVDNIFKNVEKCINYYFFIKKIHSTFKNSKKGIIGTLLSLIYMVKFKKECIDIWTSIYQKGIQWLESIGSDIKWNDLIEYFSNSLNFQTKNKTSHLNEIIKENDLFYIINKNEKTASIIGNDLKQHGLVYIPKSIIHESLEYNIIKIAEGSFGESNEIQSIEFPFNSEIQTIEKNAFKNSSIEKLLIPSSLTNLNDGWCCGTSKLVKIVINPHNKNFTFCDDNFIFGKSNTNIDTYDILVFACRNIKVAQIPSFIKKICPYAFSNSLIEEIIIPKEVIQICKCAFSYCKNLHSIKTQLNYKVEIIENDALIGTPLENTFDFPT